MECKYNIRNTCPRCGGHNLDWGDYNMDGDEVSYDYRCQDCETIGREYYVLRFDGHAIYEKNSNKWVNVNDILNPWTYENEYGEIVYTGKK